MARRAAAVAGPYQCERILVLVSSTNVAADGITAVGICHCDRQLKIHIAQMQLKREKYIKKTKKAGAKEGNEENFEIER